MHSYKNLQTCWIHGHAGNTRAVGTCRRSITLTFRALRRNHLVSTLFEAIAKKSVIPKKISRERIYLHYGFNQFEKIRPASNYEYYTTHFCNHFRADGNDAVFSALKLSTLKTWTSRHFCWIRRRSPPGIVVRTASCVLLPFPMSLTIHSSQHLNFRVENVVGQAFQRVVLHVIDCSSHVNAEASDLVITVLAKRGSLQVIDCSSHEFSSSQWQSDGGSEFAFSHNSRCLLRFTLHCRWSCAHWKGEPDCTVTDCGFRLPLICLLCVDRGSAAWSTRAELFGERRPKQHTKKRGPTKRTQPKP